MVYLVQTDTTVGFLSDSKEELAKAKNRPLSLPFITTVSSLKKLKKLRRVPKNHKKLIRRAKKTTFIFDKKLSIRVIKDKRHKKFVDRFEYIYSSSANRHKMSFDLNYAKEQADAIIYDTKEFYNSTPSKMLRVGKTKVKNFR